MEYQKIINFLNNTPNQPHKFRTKNWGKVNDNLRGTCSANNKIKIKTEIKIEIKMRHYNHMNLILASS